MKRIGVWVGVVSFLVAFAAGAQSSHKYDPVVLDGARLPAVLGAKPADMAVFAYDGKDFQPVIYQVDERYEEMLYWQWTRRKRELVYALSMGPKAKPDPNPAFDRDDELVFMFSDAGQKAPGGAGPENAKACQEIKVINPDTGGASYAYACKFDNPPPARAGSYVDLGGDNNQFTGKSYRLTYPKQHTLFFNQLQLGSRDNLSPNFLDVMKINYEVHAALGFFNYIITDADINGYLRGMKVGPVRIVKEVVSVTEPWAHVQNRMLHHVFYYPYHIEWEMETRGPINWGPIHNYNYSLTLDLNPTAKGARFLSEKNPRGVTVDGITDEEELKMNYGPQEWVALNTKWGTVYNHLALPIQAKNLYRDIYYADMDKKADPPDNYFGQFGKFGFMVRNLEKTSRKPCVFRTMYFFTPESHQAGAEKEYVEMYTRPLKVESNGLGYAVMRSLPSREEDRSPGDMPIATNAPQIEKPQNTKFFLPNFMIDPYNTGYGFGMSYTDQDFMHSGIGWDIFTLFTTRNYYNLSFNVYKLRFITFVEDFRFSAGIKQFPAQSFYGNGNDSELDHQAIYWWTRNEGTISFNKHFADHYGMDTQLFYRDTKIQGGQQPVEGTQKGKPTFEEHFGFDDELDNGERWGTPLWGRQGGHTNGVNLSFYRDMRNDPDVPHRGDFESIGVSRVGPEMASDYDYTRVSFDFRKYFEPSWLQDLPMDRWFSDKRTAYGKFFGQAKHRSIGLRVTGAHIFSEEFEYYGENMLDVPFYELTGMGGGSGNRGFYGDRFRDNDMFMASAEYRWQYWRFFDIGLFVDYGRVMYDMLEYESWEDPWRVGYGISWRAHIPPGLYMTFDYIWSEDFPGGFFTQTNFSF